MADLSRVPPQLRPLLLRFRGNTAELMQALLDGRITTEGWLSDMEAQIARFHLAAYMRGAETTEVPPYVRDWLESVIAVQLGFLGNFAMVVNAAGPKLQDFSKQFAARAQMYTSAIKVAYWQGDIIRQVGRPLPLPAMPAQGTQCGNNCGCNWRIVTLDKDAGDFDAFWERGKMDSCQTCIEREKMWSPVRIRGMMLQAGNF